MCDQEGEVPGLIIDEEKLSRLRKQKSNGAKNRWQCASKLARPTIIAITESTS